MGKRLRGAGAGGSGAGLKRQAVHDRRLERTRGQSPSYRFRNDLPPRALWSPLQQPGPRPLCSHGMGLKQPAGLSAEVTRPAWSPGSPCALHSSLTLQREVPRCGRAPHLLCPLAHRTQPLGREGIKNLGGQGLCSIQHAFIHEAPAVCQSRGPGPSREAAVSIKCFVPPGTWASGGLGRRARARWLLAPGGSLPPSFRQPQRPSPSPSSHEGVTFPARHVER